MIEEREASLMANPGHFLRRYQVVALLKVAAGYQRETEREKRSVCVGLVEREREREEKSEKGRERDYKKRYFIFPILLQ